jgi:hypothetical protein
MYIIRDGYEMINCSRWALPVSVFLVQLEGLGEVGLLRHAAARACGQRRIFVNRRNDLNRGKDFE